MSSTEAVSEEVAAVADIDSAGVETLVVRLPAKLSDVKKHLILTTLAATHGNMAAAARVLGVSRRSLYNYVQEYGWQRPTPKWGRSERETAS